MSEYKHMVKTTCKYCRREFDSFGLKKVCPNCDTHLDTWFLAIKTYLEKNPDASVAEICNDLDIPTSLIKYYLKEERLQIKNNEHNYFLKCEKCKKTINTGRYCNECQITITREEMETMLIHNPDNDNMEKEVASFHIKSMLRKK